MANPKDTIKDVIYFLGRLEDGDIVSTKYRYPPKTNKKPIRNTLTITFSKNVYPISKNDFNNSDK